MQICGEHSEVWFSLLESSHILVKHFCSFCTELALNIGIVAITYLENQFVKELLLLSRTYLLIIIAYFSVRARLFCIVFFECFSKQLFIHGFYIFATITAVKIASFAIGVLSVKFTAIVSHRAFSYFCAYRSFYTRQYFIMKGNYDTNYCDRVAGGQTRSCQDLAAQENYKAKAAENPALAIYSKYYKRYAARVRSRQIKEPDFKKWKFQALSKRDECSDGKITVEEYITWMEGCFPNRTPKT